MPLFEFKCGSCGETKESLRTLATASNDEVCTCGEIMQKVVNTSSFVLKGKGWANDGYK